MINSCQLTVISIPEATGIDIRCSSVTIEGLATFFLSHFALMLYNGSMSLL